MKYIILESKTKKIKKLSQKMRKKLLKFLTNEGFTEKQASLIISISINIGWPILIPGATVITGITGTLLAKILGRLFLKKKKKKKLDEDTQKSKEDPKISKKGLGILKELQQNMTKEEFETLLNKLSKICKSEIDQKELQAELKKLKLQIYNK